MCGIAGIYNKNYLRSSILKSQVKKMIQNLSHRGPDDSGIQLINKKICIGNARLSIVDVVGGHQPMSLNPDLHITFNGEIYNYQELKSRYFPQSTFLTVSDTEIILHAYRMFGLDAFSRLNGMFAFCIVDKNKLILVRDRIGEKPLYYKVGADKLLFASETKVLIDKKEEWGIPYNYFLFETSPNDKTLFKNINELPPGSYLIYDGKTIKVQKYWDIQKKSENTTAKNEKECVEELRYLIYDAINIRKPNLPFGVSVSGGIDSAIIACISKPDYLFSSVTKIKNFNEEKYCDYLGRYLKKPIIKTYPTSRKFISVLPELMRCIDMPTTTLAAFPMYLLAEKASKYVKVLMSGQGADELFGGYMRHVLIYIEYIKRYAPELADYQNLAMHFWGEQYQKSLAQRYFELIARGKTNNLPNQIIESCYSYTRQKPVTFAGLTDLLISFQSLLRTDDRTSMAWSIETRSPFLDYRIIEFALSLPDRLKINITNSSKDIFFTTKYILRKAVKDIVPELILNRIDKIGYPSPVAYWLKKDGFKELFANLNNKSDLPPEIKYFFLDAQSNTRGEHNRTQWQFLQFSIWYMLFIQKKSINSVENYLKKMTKKG